MGLLLFSALNTIKSRKRFFFSKFIKTVQTLASTRNIMCVYYNTLRGSDKSIIFCIKTDYLVRLHAQFDLSGKQQVFTLALMTSHWKSLYVVLHLNYEQVSQQRQSVRYTIQRHISIAVYKARLKPTQVSKNKNGINRYINICTYTYANVIWSVWLEKPDSYLV